ncbi:MAG: hypothetical protein V1867_05805 [Candidatus Falkowbacteria bacterium]
MRGIKISWFVIFLFLLLSGCGTFVKPADTIKKTKELFFGQARHNFKVLEASLKEKVQHQPEIVLWDYRVDNDPEVKAMVSHYVAGKQELMDNLRTRLNSNIIRVFFENRELLVAYTFQPEERPEFIAAYSAYFKDIARFSADLDIDLPEIKPVFINAPFPEAPTTERTAYVVYEIFKQFRLKCYFEGENGEQTNRFWFAGSFCSNQQGGVEIILSNPANGVFEVRRNPLTIWKTDTTNIFTLLATPLEERLHFLVGEYTDKKILEEIGLVNDPTSDDMQVILDKWTTVEEFIVGGLVHNILDAYLEANGLKIDPAVRGEVAANFKNAPQYKYRAAGIEFVRIIGIKKALETYKRDPGALADLLKRFSK